VKRLLCDKISLAWKLKGEPKDNQSRAPAAPADSARDILRKDIAEKRENRGLPPEIDG
jgi:hypothetical protein